MDIIAALQAKLGTDTVQGPDTADFGRHDHDFFVHTPKDVKLLGVKV